MWLHGGAGPQAAMTRSRSGGEHPNMPRLRMSQHGHPPRQQKAAPHAVGDNGAASSSSISSGSSAENDASLFQVQRPEYVFLQLDHAQRRKRRNLDEICEVSVYLHNIVLLSLVVIEHACLTYPGPLLWPRLAKCTTHACCHTESLPANNTTISKRR